MKNSLKNGRNQNGNWQQIFYSEIIVRSEMALCVVVELSNHDTDIL